MFRLVPYKKKTMSTYDPFDEFDKVLDGFFGDSFGNLQYKEGIGSMKVDIRDTDQAYLIDAELPGFNKKDIQVELKEGVLSIRAEKSEDHKEKNEDRYLRRERRYQKVERSFTVENVVEDDIQAAYDNGILSLTLPKAEPEQEVSRYIDIQ